jgi:hypothetical protein
MTISTTATEQAAVDVSKARTSILQAYGAADGYLVGEAGAVHIFEKDSEK